MASTFASSLDLVEPNGVPEVCQPAVPRSKPSKAALRRARAQGSRNRVGRVNPLLVDCASSSKSSSCDNRTTSTLVSDVSYGRVTDQEIVSLEEEIQAADSVFCDTYFQNLRADLASPKCLEERLAYITAQDLPADHRRERKCRRCKHARDCG